MEHVIVERTFETPVTPEEVDASLARSAGCLVAHRVRHLRTSVSADGVRMICEFLAPDAESVRLANDRLGLPYERVWTARVFEANASIGV